MDDDADDDGMELLRRSMEESRSRNSAESRFDPPSSSSRLLFVGMPPLKLPSTDFRNNLVISVVAVMMGGGGSCRTDCW